MAKQNITTVALVFLISLVALMTFVSATPSFTMTFNYPTEDAILNTDNFVASISANEVLDSMDINLDGGAYYHACNNCNGFTVPVDRLLDGPHTLNLIGVSGTTTKDITLNFTTDTTAPTVPNVVPAVGATNVAVTTNVIATFSETMQSSTITTSTFTLRDSSNNVVAGSVSASGNTATFNPTNDLTAGATYTATLTNGIRDLAGNAIAQGSWTFTTAGSSSGNTTNTTTPAGPYSGFSLIFTSPTEGQVIANNQFTATVVANETVDMMRINLNGGSYIVGCTNCNGFSVPVNNMQDGTHNLNVIATWGSVTEDTTVNFVIDTSGGADTTAPTVSSTSPTSGATGVAAGSNVIATFSETMQSSTITTSTFTLRDSSNNVVAGSVSASGNTATFNPTNDLTAGATYTATITTGAQDSAGNALASPHTWSFTVANAADTTAPAPVSNLFASATGITFITWSWTNPSDSDFQSAILFLNGVNTANVSANTYTASGLTGNTTHNLTIYTKDTSGNVNMNGVSSIVTTTAQPASNTTNNTNVSTLQGFVINSPIQGQTFNDQLHLDITAGDATNINYSIDGGAFANYAGHAAISLAEGAHVLTVRASNDQAFNETSINFNIVNTTETGQNNTNQTNNNTELVMFNVTSPINGSIYNDSVLLNITECDHDSVNYSIDGGAFMNYTGPVVIPLTAGMHNITVLGSNSMTLDEVVIYFTIVNSSTTPGNETNQTSNNQTNQTGNNGNSNNNANNNVNTGSSNGGSGGSGGAGGVFRIFQANDVSASAGYTQLMSRNDKIYFNLLGNNSARYVLMMKSLGNNTAIMQVRGVDINLQTGESTRVNLSGSDNYDLYVMLNSVQNGRANVTIQTIDEEIPVTTTVAVQNSASTEGEATATSDTEEGSTLITGNAIAEGNSNTNSNTNVFARVFNFVQSIFRNMFSSIGGMFNR